MRLSEMKKTRWASETERGTWMCVQCPAALVHSPTNERSMTMKMVMLIVAIIAMFGFAGVAQAAVIQPIAATASNVEGGNNPAYQPQYTIDGSEMTPGGVHGDLAHRSVVGSPRNDLVHGSQRRAMDITWVEWRLQQRI